MKRTFSPKLENVLRSMASDQRWQLKVGRNLLREDVIRDVKTLQCHPLKKNLRVNSSK
jgi:hypothetical protein